MIAVVSLLSVITACWLRAMLGEFGLAVPFVGLAWVVLWARRSTTGSFVAAAVGFGLLDGLTSLTAWTAYPLVYLALGLAAFWTRRILPVSRARGEALVGMVIALLAVLLLWPFRGTNDLGRGSDLSWTGAIGGVVTTGPLIAALVAVTPRWPVAWLRRPRQ